jgi:non-canonical poly(A) RNA polymerase PAPD5/7
MNDSLLGKKKRNIIQSSQQSSETTTSPNSKNTNLNSPSFSPIQINEEMNETNVKFYFNHFENNNSNKLSIEEKKELKDLLKLNKIDIPPIVIYEKEKYNNPFKNIKIHLKDDEINDGKIPWIKDNSDTNKYTGILKLHYEIIDFYNFIKLTKKEENIRYKVFNNVMEVINKHYPNYKGEIFGSFPQGLSLSNSDLDIFLYFKNCPNDKKEILKILSNILRILKQSGKFRKIFLISAKVPIIKCLDKNSGIKIDISINRKSNYITNSYVKSIINKYPCIQYLTLLIKFYLRQRKLNDTHKGGISSIVIFNLIYAYILYAKKINKYNENIINLGSILIDFFEFFGYIFQYKNIEINNLCGGFFKIRNDNDSNLLYLNNPIDNQNMLKNTYNFERVILAFQNALNCLYNPNQPEKSYLSDFIIPNFILKRRSEIIEK